MRLEVQGRMGLLPRLRVFIDIILKVPLLKPFYILHLLAVTVFILTV